MLYISTQQARHAISPATLGTPLKTAILFIVYIWGIGIIAPINAQATITGPMVSTTNWPRVNNLNTWANDVLRIDGNTNASDRDKAISLYYWTRLFVMSPKAGTEPYEGPWGAEERLEKEVHKVMFVHGAGDCDYQARALEAVWCAYKNDDYAARRISLVEPVHSMVELEWDGTWHGFDMLNGVFFIEEDAPNANVLSFAQSVHSEDLLMANENFTWRSRPFFERVRSWEGEDSEWWLHLALKKFHTTIWDWENAGKQPLELYASHSMPSLYPLHQMDWQLPRGTAVVRHWKRGPIFYQPQTYAAQFGSLGRHYRQATGWGGMSHWNLDEDRYNFPRVAPYVERCSDETDNYFFGQDTYYMTSTGTITWDGDLWSDAWKDAVVGTPGLKRADSPPYLRPESNGTIKSVIFQVNSPYIMADAQLDALVTKGPGDTARFLLSTDMGATWDLLSSHGGKIHLNIGKSRFDGTQQAVSGVYQYFIKFECKGGARAGAESGDTDTSTVGLNRISLQTWIDGSMNALPRLMDGENTVRVSVSSISGPDNPQVPLAPLQVEYGWKNETGQAHTYQKNIQPSELAGDGEATFTIQAPGLTRNNFYSFSYGSNDQDDNGLPDTWEILHFDNVGQDPQADPDQDGTTNMEAFLNGLVPGHSNDDEPDTGTPDNHDSGFHDGGADGPDTGNDSGTGKLIDDNQDTGCSCSMVSISNGLYLIPAIGLVYYTYTWRKRRRHHTNQKILSR